MDSSTKSSKICKMDQHIKDARRKCFRWPRIFWPSLIQKPNFGKRISWVFGTWLLVPETSQSPPCVVADAWQVFVYLRNTHTSGFFWRCQKLNIKKRKTYGTTTKNLTSRKETLITIYWLLNCDPGSFQAHEWPFDGN